ncbi:hypothetical protein ACS0TY_023331 [Phlomoides rotata]
MDYSVFLTVNFKGESKLIEVNGSSSFTDVQSHILGTWIDLKIDTLTCRFSVGSIRNCCLVNDVDLKNLLLICQHTLEKLTIVDVDSSVINVGHSSHGSNDRETEKQSRVSNVSDLGSSSQREFTGKGRIHSYPMCPIDSRKTYLSDKWVDIMVDGVGKEFSGGATEFRMELIKYTTRLGFKFKYVRNDSRYIHAVCNDVNNRDCPWFIKAKRLIVNNHFVVSKVNLNHECVGNFVVQKKSRLGYVIIAKLVLQSYGVDIPYWKAWRIVEAARNQIFGSYSESYDHLRWYCEAIQKTNPGSVVDLVKNSETNCFERVFIAYKACIDGFRKCRPMLFIDDTFMKGRAKGTLLAATAKDGDNGLFPVAFAIVSAETTDNWVWFLKKLRDFVHHDKQVFYISNRNCGLMSAFPYLNFLCIFIVYIIC